MASVANVALTEPIHHNEKLERDSISPEPSGRRSDVVFEDFLYFAAIQRREEAGDTAPESTWLTRLSDHKGRNVNVDVADAKPPPMTEDEEEAATASRSLRLASWSAVFYLITTDILGPFNAPYAISQVGWVPGKFAVDFKVVCRTDTLHVTKVSFSTSLVRERVSSRLLSLLIGLFFKWE